MLVRKTVLTSRDFKTGPEQNYTLQKILNIKLLISVQSYLHRKVWVLNDKFNSLVTDGAITSAEILMSRALILSKPVPSLFR